MTAAPLLAKKSVRRHQCVRRRAKADDRSNEANRAPKRVEGREWRRHFCTALESERQRESQDMTGKRLTVWTIGHSTRSSAEFTGVLRVHNIQAIADVRRYPGSRRHPQFNQGPLRELLAGAGIQYHHFPELGGRRKSRPDSPNTVWRNESFRGYADHMQTGEFEVATARLLSLAAKVRTAMMCAEILWWRCHRALISDALKAAGHQVEHIISATKTVPHSYTSAASIINGKLFYATARGQSELALSQ